MTAAAGHCVVCGVETFFARPMQGGEMIELDAQPLPKFGEIDCSLGIFSLDGDPRSSTMRPVAEQLGPLDAFNAEAAGQPLYRRHAHEAAS